MKLIFLYIYILKKLIKKLKSLIKYEYVKLKLIFQYANLILIFSNFNNILTLNNFMLNINVKFLICSFSKIISDFGLNFNNFWLFFIT